MLLREGTDGVLVEGQNDGDVLTWDEASREWFAEPGGGGGALPPGDFEGQALYWDGAAWVPVPTGLGPLVRIDGLTSVDASATSLNLGTGQASLVGETAQLNDSLAQAIVLASNDRFFLSYSNGVAPLVQCTGDAAGFVVNVDGPRFVATDTSAELAAGSTVTADAAGLRLVAAALTTLNLEGPVIQIQDSTAATYVALSASTLSQVGAETATLAATPVAGVAGVTFAAGGAELSASTGQTVGIVVNALQRFLADDTSAQVIAGGSFIHASPTGIRVVPESGGSATLESASAVRIRANGTGLGFFGATPVGVQSITGVLTQDQVDSIVAALVALGLVSDDRVKDFYAAA